VIVKRVTRDIIASWQRGHNRVCPDMTSAYPKRPIAQAFESMRQEFQKSWLGACDPPAVCDHAGPHAGRFGVVDTRTFLPRPFLAMTQAPV
jgi:hypothetical protein